MGYGNIDLRFGQARLFREQVGFGHGDRRLGGIPCGDARFPLVGRFEKDLGSDCSPGNLAFNPLDLRVPPVDLGLKLAQNRPGLDKAQPRQT